MLLPITAYGHPVLRKMAGDITPEYPELQKFIADMWETMYAASGVGIAAPQVGRPIRLFVIDTIQIVETFDDQDRKEFPNEKPVKQVFINAHKIEEAGTPWPYNEGCLSIPKVREDIKRAETVTIRYMDENFTEHTQTFSGLTARVVLHEYDHIDGKLFIDLLPPLKKRLLKKRLDDITAGKVKTEYRMTFSR
jgi:peptide deformylase